MIDGKKKMPMRILIPSMLADCLGIALPEGWDEKPERMKRNSNVSQTVFSKSAFQHGLC